MEIKFKKLFKTTLLFFVVFVMIFNSFAAISVSDGSAFVTKAEFSADLNNLSNRMSALENSIDAKIDSLVSSYLSRNGIWNGEKQTTVTTRYWTISPKGGIFSNQRNSWSGDLTNNTIINTVSKSGLLVGFIYYTDGNRSNLNSNDSRWGYSVEHMNTSNWLSDCGFFVSANLFETTSGSTTAQIKSSTVIGSAIGSLKAYNYNKQNVVAFPLPSTKILIPVSFFVQQGSKITLTVTEDVHFDYIDPALTTNNKIIGNALRVGFENQFYVY